MRNYFDKDDAGGKSTGLAGTAAAFQSGFNMGGKDKAKKPKKEKPVSDTAKAKSGPVAGQLSSMPAASFYPGTLIPQGKHGGRVKKTGLIYLHRGEHVTPAKRSRQKAAGHKRTVIKT